MNRLRYHKFTKGFSLIEMIVAVAIISILASLSIPAFNSKVRKSRRTEGITALLETSREFEEYRSQNGAYPPSNTNLPSNSDFYRYNSTTTSNSYTINAVAQGGQASDVEGNYSCSTISITNTGYASPPECWRGQL